MGFCSKVRALVWKNNLVRRRHKIRLLLETVWPLVVFVILLLEKPSEEELHTGIENRRNAIHRHKSLYDNASHMISSSENSTVDPTRTTFASDNFASSTPFPYTPDPFSLALAPLMPLLMIQAWVFTFSAAVRRVVQEKQERVKETLAVMGLGRGVQWAGWFVDGFLTMAISSVILCAVLVSGKLVPHADFGLVLVFLLSFMVAALSFAFLVSVFFSRSNIAGPSAGVIYWLAFPLFELVSTSESPSLSAVLASALVPTVAYAQGSAVIANLELSGEGANWSNINKPPDPTRHFTMASSIGMLWFDTLLCAILTWYIEAVFPGQYGVPKPFLFFLEKSYWCGSPQSDHIHLSPSSGHADPKNFEAEPEDAVVGITMDHLTKVFGKKAAVDGVTLNFYQDQITCFLGHNGAGKTTTISMLTGMFPPTAGTARVYGRDIRTHMDEIRSNMGVCPQHNVLLSSLTVREHLYFFGRIKGIPDATLYEDVDRLLKEMNLEDKGGAMATTLSGGMKRKLSIGMAFVGGSKVVFLDEPTAGVDPFSRRGIWDLLAKFRKGRTVVLTTHFMDEADLLGDRIAIMSQGRLQCYGSGEFLKQRLGSGYHLTVEWQRLQRRIPDRISRMEKLVQTAVPGALPEVIRSGAAIKLDSSDEVDEVLNEVVYLLPDRHDIQAITGLLEKLDEQQESLGIASYGISDTSLEEIFLKITRQATPGAEENEVITIDDGLWTQKAPLEGAKLLWQQYTSLTRKRYNYVRKDPKTLFTQVLLPAVFILLALAFNPSRSDAQSTSQAASVLSSVITVIFAMSFVPASFVMFLVEDRVGQSKHLQLVSGLRPYIYWLQTYCWDLVSFAVSEVLVILIFVAFQNPMYTSGSNVVALIILIFLYGMAGTPLLYLASWLFKVPSMAFIVLSCGNLFVGLVTTVTKLILTSIKSDAVQYVEKAFLVLPQYCLGQGLMNMALNYVKSEYPSEAGKPQPGPLDWETTGKFMVALAVLSVVFMLAVLVVEQGTHWLHRHAEQAAKTVPDEEDVRQEYDRVVSGAADQDVLVLKQILKRYKRKGPPAVDGVALGVARGQCFGLLGLNGAGKTTTLKMLTGDTPLSGGDALVNGRSVRNDMDGVRRMVGYCPQVDALLPLLTVRDHLLLYTGLRGVQPSERLTVVSRVIELMSLSQYENTQAKSLSGGNKRKLSAAIALVGDPWLLYMDEPTTSMDPAARRLVWDRVQALVSTGRSVVLTSHSMEECEALCSRLTIMVNGRLTCIGSPQHLKHKYGCGYSTAMSCPLSRLHEARDLLLSLLPGSTVVEQHRQRLKLHVPLQHVRVADLFRALDRAHTEGCVIEYTVQQTTLEDVFMRFAQMQAATS